MDQIGEKHTFKIQPVVEQKPFENPTLQNFFNKWCEINDTIRPVYLERIEWERKRESGILEMRSDGNKSLFIPKDLQLWEMVGVMEVVDNDTFTLKPERQAAAKEKLHMLAKTFQNTGTYIAQRLEMIVEGQDIAKALSIEFYEYGQSLLQGEQPMSTPDIGAIAAQNLSPEEIESVDRFLAGDTLYETRLKRVEKVIAEDPSRNVELFEIERINTLCQFFRVAEKAFSLKNKSSDGELLKSTTELKPWENDTPIHNQFLARIEKAMKQKIVTPKNELVSSVFRRGLEKLIKEMRQKRKENRIINFFEQLGVDLIGNQNKLKDTLQISKLNAELKKLRQTGDIAIISQKEREIADIIQTEVSSFPRTILANNPAEILANQYVNCLGASILGGALMSEAGLNYLVGGVPNHSILFLVNSNGEVEWRDMLNISFNEKLTDEMIDGHNNDGTPLLVKDIVAFSQKPKPEGLMFDIRSDMYRKKISWVNEGERQFIGIFAPEYGQQIQVLNNTGSFLCDLNRYEDAAEMFQQAIAEDPQYAYPFNGLGNALNNLGRQEEAIEAYKKAIALDPQYEYPYYGLGIVLNNLGRQEEAIEAYKKAIAVNPQYASPYNGLGNVLIDLDRNDEALEVFQQGLTIDSKNVYSYNGLGVALNNLERNEEAVEAFKMAIALDPNYVQPYNNLGNVLIDLDRNDEALEVFQQGLTIDSKFANPYYGLGIVFSELGRNEEAVEAFKNFIKFANVDKYKDFIKFAEKRIVKLQK